VRRADAGRNDDVGPPVRTPVDVVRVDVEQPLQAVSARDGCRTARVFAFTGATPLGALDVDLRSGPLAGDELLARIRDELGTGGATECAARAAALPRASVVVATSMRRLASLERCVQDLLELDYPDYEIIVVDNRPRPDGTALPAVLSHPRVRVVHEPRRGASHARNRGASEAGGEVIAFTDDDVEIDPSWLRALAARIASDPSVACVTGLVLPAELVTPAQAWFEQYGGFAKGFTARTYRPASPPPGLFPYAAGTFGSGNNVAFRTSVLSELGGYDPALGPGTDAPAGEELALFVSLLSAGHSFAYEPAAVVWHHHRRTYGELRNQLHGYGIGLSAMLTSLVVHDPAHLLRVLRRVPAGLRLLTSRRSAKNAGRSAGYPRGLVLAELAGFLIGPWRYLRSRRALAADCRARGGAGGRPSVAASPLVRNATALMTSTIVTAILGVVFWAVAARTYPAELVGLGSAAIAAMNLLANVAQLNLASVFPRFLPTAGSGTRRLLGLGYLATVTLSLAVAGVFVASGFGRAYLSQLGPPAGTLFVAAVALWTVFTIQDAAMTGLGGACWVPVENGSFSVVKVALLPVFAVIFPRGGIFLAWLLPVAVALVPVNWYLYRRLAPAAVAAAGDVSNLPGRRALGSFVAGDYLGSLAANSMTALLPLLVVALCGATANAYFYACWVVVTGFDLLLNNLATSLVVEAARDPGRTRTHLRRATLLAAAVLAPAVVLGLLLAPSFLDVLGRGYAGHGAMRLRLTILAMPLRAVGVLYLAFALISRRIRRVITIQVVNASAIVGGSVALLGRLGIGGVGVAYLAAQLVVALGVGPSVVRQYRSASDEADARPAGQVLSVAPAARAS
jgi:GT2 family glycosyltransferase/O-antigen/teichoic acid export membrane protein